MPTPPPIIIKKKAAHGGHHGGAWKVAYADFVTAMMALFIVLWLLNSSVKVQKAVGGYFRDPSGTASKMGSEMDSSEENFVITKDNMEQLKDQLQKAIREVPKFDKLKNQIDMTVTNEGLRIELTESAAGTFFDSGSAKMSGDGSDLLKLLAGELGKLPNHMAMEGHTDAKPYPASAIYTNWELSADRANAARRLMQQNGLGPDQITQVRGFASQRLRKTDAPLDPSNRRISLIVQYLKKGSDEASGEGEKEGEGGETKTEKSGAEGSGEAKTRNPDEKAAAPKESSEKPAASKPESGKTEPKKQ
jgi:chemotaxis protein MotB